MRDVKKMVGVVVFAAALTPLVSACGSGSGSCLKVQPCGGNVVGNYSVSASCVNRAALDMTPIASCPGASVNVGAIKVTGTASFNADMSYSVSETITVSASETIPSSCLTMNGLTLTCAQVDQLIQQSVQQDPTMFQSARCSGGSSSCTCTFTLAPQTIAESGTYTTSGTTITMTDTGGGISSAEYCAQGNELHLLSVDMTMPMGTIEADTVLTKR